MQLIEIYFEIDGKRVDPRNAGNALEGAMFSAIENVLRQNVGSCRCSEHGQAPTLTAKGRSLDQLNYEVSGCCDKVIEDVKNRLSA